jgi:hypothetical protein
MKKTVLAITLGLACVTSAHANDWKFLTSGSNKTNFYVRNGGSYHSGQTVLKFVWVKYENSNKTYTIARHQFNCEYQSTSVQDSNLYAETGTLIQKNPYEETRIVRPNSIDEALFKYTCLKS